MAGYKYRTMLSGIGVLRNNFIYGVTEDVMKYLIQGGIAQNFVKYVETVTFKPRQDEEEERKSFGLNDLELGFMVYLTISLSIHLRNFIWRFFGWTFDC